MGTHTKVSEARQQIIDQVRTGQITVTQGATLLTQLTTPQTSGTGASPIADESRQSLSCFQPQLLVKAHPTVAENQQDNAVDRRTRMVLTPFIDPQSQQQLQAQLSAERWLDHTSTDHAASDEASNAPPAPLAQQHDKLAKACLVAVFNALRQQLDEWRLAAPTATEDDASKCCIQLVLLLDAATTDTQANQLFTSALSYALSALLKSLSKEQPHITTQLLVSDTDPASLHQIHEEWNGSADFVVLQQQQRLERALVAAPQFNHATSAKGDPPPQGQQLQRHYIKAGGTYLIIGGAGGIGLICARDILSAGSETKVILSGRRSLAAVQNQAAFRALQTEFGSERITYHACDGSDYRATWLLLRQLLTKDKVSQLSGILQCSGYLQDHYFTQLSAPQLLDVFASKATVTLNLLYALQAVLDAKQAQQLDFVALASSCAGQLGFVGQANYAAANGFLDGLAAHGHWQTQLSTVNRSPAHETHPVLQRLSAINWPLWQAGGMQTAVQIEQELQDNYGLVALPNEQALELLDRALTAGNTANLLVTYGDAERIQRHYIDEEPINQTPIKASATNQSVATNQASADPQALHPHLVVALKDLLAGVLKIPTEQLDALEPLPRFGIDSFAIVRINAELAKQLGQVSKTLLYEVDTISDLATTLLRLKPVQVANWLSATAVKVSTATASRSEAPTYTAAPESITTATQTPSTSQDAFAIIGISIRFPGADSLSDYWQALRQGQDLVREIPADRWDMEGFFEPDQYTAISSGKSYCRHGGFIDDVYQFDEQLFQLSPREAEAIDPHERLLLQTSWRALEDAGYPKLRLQQRYQGEVGVFAGITKNGFNLYGPPLWAQGERTIPSTSFSSVANRISYLLDLTGPSMPIDTMCSSSLVAIHEALKSLRAGECQLAIVGAANLYLHPSNYTQLCASSMLSPTGRCYSFGDQADGFVPGEGVASIIVKPLDRAQQDGDRVYAQILGSAVNHGGHAKGYTVPNLNAQARLLQRAMSNADVTPAQMSYIEAHGTGTVLGDPIELNALKLAFANATDTSTDTSPPPKTCAIGSVKSNIGHLEASAGLAGVVKVILQMQHRQLVPSLHAENLNPNLDFADSPFALQRQLSDWHSAEPNGQLIAGVSSFGAAGVNAHVILGSAKAIATPVRSDNGAAQALLVTANTLSGVKRNTDALHRYLTQAQNRTDLSVQQLAYSLQIGRHHHSCRALIIANSMTNVIAGLDAIGSAISQNAAISAGNATELCDGVWLGERIAKAEQRQHQQQQQQTSIAQALREQDVRTLGQAWLLGNFEQWSELYTGANAHANPGWIALPHILPSYEFASREHSFLPRLAASGHPKPATTEQQTAASSAPSAAQTTELNISDVRRYLRITLAATLRMQVEDIGDDNAFGDYGLDSILGVDLVHQINHRFQIALQTTCIYDYPDINTLAEYVAQQVPASAAPAASSEPSAVQADTTVQLGAVSDHIVQQVARVLRMDSDQVQRDIAFVDYGLDSILGVDLIHHLNQHYALALKTTCIYDYVDAQALAAHIVATLSADNRPATAQRDDATNGLAHQSKPQSQPATSQSIHTKTEDIAVIGMSGRFGPLNDIDEFWQCISVGDSAITPVTRWNLANFVTPELLEDGMCLQGGFVTDIDQFDAVFFNIAGVEANYMDPQQRVFLEQAWLSLEDAGYTGSRLNEQCKQTCGVYVGNCSGDYAEIVDNSKAPAQALWGNIGAFIPSRIAYLLNLKGPAISFDTSCSSSLVAIHQACKDLRLGEVDTAIAGGVFTQATPRLFVQAAQAGMLSPTGTCSPFDDKANGFVPGEAAATVVLKRLSDAARDGDNVRALIRGHGINQDGRTNGITAPSAVSQAALIKQIYQDFAISPNDISLVEAHGTGTSLGDPIEFNALCAAFDGSSKERNYCSLGSVKANVGHTQFAAGVTAFIKCVLALEHQILPPLLNYQRNNPKVDMPNSPFYPVTTATHWQSRNGQRLAAVSAFGASGTNAHTLIGEAPMLTDAANQTDTPQLVLLSAPSEAQLASLAQRLSNKLQALIHNPPPSPVANKYSLPNIAYTLALGRKHFAQRLAIIAASVTDLQAQLAAIVAQPTQINPLPLTAPAHLVAQAEQYLKQGGPNEQDFAGSICSLPATEFQRASFWVKNQVARQPIFKADPWQDPLREPISDAITPASTPVAATPAPAPITHTARASNAAQHTSPNVDKPPVINGRSSVQRDVTHCEMTIRGDEFYVADHAVQGTPILPGVMYIELMRRALLAVHQDQFQQPAHLTLKDLVWVQPLPFSIAPATAQMPPQQQTVVIEISRTQGGRRSAPRIDVSVLSRDSRQPYAQAQFTPQQQLQEIDVASTLQSLSILPANRSDPREAFSEAALAQMQKIPAVYCSQLLRSQGVLHGTRMQAIRQLFCSRSHVVAKLQLPAAFAGNVAPFTLHPCIADSAIQALAILGYANAQSQTKAAPATSQSEQSATKIPFALERFTQLRPLPASVWCVGALQAPAGMTQGAAAKTKWHVAIFAPNGQLCVLLDGYTQRAIATSSTAAQTSAIATPPTAPAATGDMTDVTI